MARLDERPGFYVAFLALVEHPKGGRRQDAKRPKKRGARGPLAPGPALFVWQAGGRPWGPPLGRQTPPPPARPPRPFRFPRATAVGPAGGALGNGEGVAVGLRGGRRRFAGPKGPQNQSMGGGQRPPPMLCARCARPPPPWGAGIFHRPNDPSTNPFRPGFQQRNLARRSR